MHFDPDLLLQKLQAIEALQKATDFKPKVSAGQKEKQERAAARLEKKEFRERLKAEIAAKKQQKIASAAMLQAERMARENKERAAKKAAADKKNAERQAKKLAGKKVDPGESYWGSETSSKPPKRQKVRKPDAGQERTFETKAFKPEEMIKVQINPKTVVYVKPGADIEAVMAKYKKEPLVKDKYEGLPPSYQF